MLLFPTCEPKNDEQNENENKKTNPEFENLLILFLLEITNSRRTHTHTLKKIKKGKYRISVHNYIMNKHTVMNIKILLSNNFPL
jgi:hypothetical protein